MKTSHSRNIEEHEAAVKILLSMLTDEQLEHFIKYWEAEFRVTD